MTEYGGFKNTNATKVEQHCFTRSTNKNDYMINIGKVLTAIKNQKMSGDATQPQQQQQIGSAPTQQQQIQQSVQALSMQQQNQMKAQLMPQHQTNDLALMQQAALQQQQPQNFQAAQNLQSSFALDQSCYVRA